MENLYTPTMASRGTLSAHLQHSGKWTVEEKEYADALAAEFQAGVLDIEEGVSLRRFLSQALRCSAKRISKKYEGSDYNGKMLYQKCDRVIPSEEAEERKEKLQRLEKKYQESLKVLKMVEDSKQSQRQPSAVAAHHHHHHGDLGAAALGARLPHSFLQSTSANSAAALATLGGGGGLLTPGAAHLEAELTLQRAAARNQAVVAGAATTGDSLLQAYVMTNSLSSRGGIPGLPLFPPAPGVGLGPRGLSDGSEDSSSRSHLLRRTAGSPALTAAAKMSTAMGLTTTPLGATPAAAAIIRQGWRPGQTMLLPNSFASLHHHHQHQNLNHHLQQQQHDAPAGEGDTTGSTRGGPSAKKAQQNALILAALMNRKTPKPLSPAAEDPDGISTATLTRKRQLDHEFTLPPTSAKFSRLV